MIDGKLETTTIHIRTLLRLAAPERRKELYRSYESWVRRLKRYRIRKEAGLEAE